MHLAQLTQTALYFYCPPLPLALTSFPPSILQDSLSFDGKDLIKNFNSDSFSTCLTMGLCTSSHLLTEEAPLMMTGFGTDLRV